MAIGKLNDEVRFAIALGMPDDVENLTGKRVMRRGNPNTLDVPVLQPLILLTAVSVS